MICRLYYRYSSQCNSTFFIPLPRRFLIGCDDECDVKPFELSFHAQGCSKTLSELACQVYWQCFVFCFWNHALLTNVCEKQGIEGIIHPFLEVVPVMLMDFHLSSISVNGHCSHQLRYYPFKDAEFDNMCGRIHLAGLLSHFFFPPLQHILSLSAWIDQTWSLYKIEAEQKEEQVFRCIHPRRICYHLSLLQWCTETIA